MDIDFTKLNNISNIGKNGETEKNAPHRTAYNQINDNEQYETSKQPLNATRGNIEALESISTKSRNYIASTGLMSEINKEIKQGENIYRLFLKAIKIISLMTENSLYYTQIEADIREVYGIGTLEPVPLILELEQIQERMKRLKEAEEREQDNQRIKIAIKAHEIRETQIQELIKASGI